MGLISELRESRSVMSRPGPFLTRLGAEFPRMSPEDADETSRNGAPATRKVHDFSILVR